MRKYRLKITNLAHTIADISLIDSRSTAVTPVVDGPLERVVITPWRPGGTSHDVSLTARRPSMVHRARCLVALRSVHARSLLVASRWRGRAGRLRQHQRHRHGLQRRRCCPASRSPSPASSARPRHRRHQRVGLLRQGPAAARRLRGEGRARRLQDRRRAARRGQRRHADAGRLRARGRRRSPKQSTVTGGSPLLKTDRADVATRFDSKQLTDLPVLDRNFTKFILLTPGTQQLGWQHAASENPQGSDADDGQRPALQRHGLSARRHREPRPDPRHHRHQPDARVDWRDEDHLAELRRGVRPGDGGRRLGADQVRQPTSCTAAPSSSSRATAFQARNPFTQFQRRIR